MKRTTLTKLLTTITLIAIVLALSLLYTSNPFTDRMWRGDSSMFIYFGKAMRAGKKIYTEIFDHKGPVIFVLNYLGTFLPGRVTGIYWLELSALAAGTWGMYRIARLYLDRWLSCILIACYALTLSRYLQNGNLTEAYALPMWIYSLYLFIRHYRIHQSISLYEAIFVGVQVMLAFLLRANLIVSWVPLILILLVDYIRHHKWQLLRTTIFGFAIGFISVGLLSAICLMAAGVWDAFIFQAFTFNFNYLSHSIGGNVIQKFLFEMAKDYSLIVLMLFGLNALIRRKQGYLVMGLVGAFVFTFYAALLSGRAYLHYLMLVFPIIAVMGILLLAQLPLNQKWQTYLLGVILLGCYVPQMRLFQQQVIAENRLIVQWIQQQPVAENKHDQQAKEVSQYVQSITQPDDAIYSLYEAGRIYLLSDRLAHTKYFSLPAVNFNEFPELIAEFYQEFDANPPKVIVLKKGALNQVELPFTQQLIQRIEAGYTLRFENSKYDVYQQKASK